MKSIMSLALCLLLLGCGAKGDLYLPKPDEAKKSEETKGTN